MASEVMDHGWIVHGRPRLNLAMRLTTRAHELISAGGAARGTLRVTAAGVSTLADLALTLRLARSRRSELALHWVVDAADLALWTALSTRPGYSQLTTAMNSGHPLAIEAGARLGLRGLSVPVANCVVSGVVQRARRRHHTPGAFAWQAAAAAAGAGLARYARRLRSERLAAHEATLGPELTRAELSAQNELALGLDNLLDEAQRAAVLVQLAVSRPRNTAGDWKADLATQTRSSHRYLVDTLLMWQRRHNETPHLSEVVELVVAPALAPVVLSPDEASALARRLDGLSLRGQVTVTGGPSRSSADGIELDVGGSRVKVRGTAPPVRLTFDPLPGGFGWMALWLAVGHLRDGVPRREAFGTASVAAALMLWAHRASRGGDAAPRDTAVLASTALALAASIAQTRTMPDAHDADGHPRVPASLALRGHAFVTALAREGLRPSTMAMAWAGGAAALAGAWALTPAPRPVREFAAELTWVAMAASIARAFTEGIRRDSADLEVSVKREVERRLDASAALGRRRALAVVDDALGDAEHLYGMHAHEIDPSIREEVRRRLDGVHAQLAQARSSTLAAAS